LTRRGRITAAAKEVSPAAFSGRFFCKVIHERPEVDMDSDQSKQAHRMNVALIGNYVPRKCGLATFTTDMATWVRSSLSPDSDVFVVAMNDRPEGYDYPPMVRFEVEASNPRDYPRAADYVNMSDVDVVSLQHEFGIFGGAKGIYVADMLRDLRKPVITTAHTVLPDPEPDRLEAMKEVCELSDAIVVMSRKSTDFLDEYYGCPREKVHLIHHGVPDMPFAESEGYKPRWGLQGKTVLLTFGLLHPRKGIEHVIRAMPAIVESFPEAVYVVLGATHPPYKRREGEKYRFYLKGLARELGVEDSVLFYDRFVSLEELTSMLAACDIYVTPYLDMNQIVSGTLAYAMGLGKPIISTPYYYAVELLAEERGIVVPVEDSSAMFRAATGLLADPESMLRMREKVYAFGRRMTWPNVSREYVELFEHVLAGRRAMPAAVARRQEISLRDLPRPRLDHLVRMTDDVGIIRSAQFDIPDRSSGYRTEDNALALAAVVLDYVQTEDPVSMGLARTYLSFIRYMQSEDGNFESHLDYNKVFSAGPGGQDCTGKVLAGLGLTVALSSDEPIVSFAKLMFDDALKDISLTYIRSMAYAICGCYHYLTRFPGASLPAAALARFASGLVQAYDSASEPGWEWFEDSLTYANGLMPRALLLAYRETREERYREVALASLDFLTRTCLTDEGYFNLVGDAGWYEKGGQRAVFNQLPVEATSLADAYIDAYVVEREDKYLGLARAAFEWFLGRNALNTPLYDFASFCCADSLMLHGPSLDKSAEATTQWLLALLRVQTSLHVGADLLEQRTLAGR
jgi:glycosyltransferase involved in cell wall biosynthesis